MTRGVPPPLNPWHHGPNAIQSRDGFMRRLLLIAFTRVLVGLLATSPAAAQEGKACKGALWKKVQGWLKPEMTFQDTVLFLQSEGIDYAVFDARTAPAAAEGEVDVNTGHIGATDCKPRKESPACSVVFSEPSAESKSNPASPTFVESDEFIAIDFDAKGKQTGHACEVVETAL